MSNVVGRGPLRAIGILFCLSFAAGALGHCGSGSDPVICGQVTCGRTQTCDLASSPPQCRCIEGYAGASCTSCATGYMMVEGGYCVLIPLDCARVNACGVRGTCMQVSGGEPICVCQAGYAGRVCDQCAAGYQDNDNNRTCTPNCASMATTCTAPRTCSDATGTAVCGCPPNTTGANCETCLSGFVRDENNTCVRSCTANSCPAGQYCDMTPTVPVCACRPGFVPPACTDCASGFVRDTATGNCVAVVAPAGTTLLGVGVTAGGTQLLAIDPVARKAIPMRPVPNPAPTQLASDTGAKTLYALTQAGVQKLDLGTGTYAPVSANVTQTQNLAFAQGSLFSIPDLNPNLLKRIDPASGLVTDVGPTLLPAVQGLGFDPTTGALLAARPVNNAPTLSTVALASGAATPMGTVTYDDAPLPAPLGRIGLAIEPGTNKIFVTAAIGRTPQALFTDHCQRVGKGVGLRGYEQAPFTTFDVVQTGVGAGMTKSLKNTNATGKEIVAYASYGVRTAAQATLRFDVTNPETFVCVMTYEENLKLFIPAAAKFAGIVVTGYRPFLALEVETGFPGVAMPLLHVYGTSSASIDSTVRAYAVSRVYTQQEWETTKRLPAYTSLWGTDTTAPVQLFELDRATLKPKQILTFEDVTLQTPLAPWAP